MQCQHQEEQNEVLGTDKMFECAAETLCSVMIGPPFSFSISLPFTTRDLSCDHHVITYVTYCFVMSIVCDPLSR